jgi:putative PIN family toxin of toxin-antitoxin system
VITVFDTHVMVAALLSSGICHECFERTLGRDMLASSPALLDEIESVLRPAFQITGPVRNFLSTLRDQVRLVEPTPLPSRVCRHEHGDLVLATAAEAGAGLVVSADADLLAVHSFDGIRLVSPRWFLRWLDGREQL